MARQKSPVTDTRGAGAYLGLAESTLEKLRCQGGGPRFVKMGRKVMYRYEDLDTYIDARVVRVTGESAA